MTGKEELLFDDAKIKYACIGEGDELMYVMWNKRHNVFAVGDTYGEAIKSLGLLTDLVSDDGNMELVEG